MQNIYLKELEVWQLKERLLDLQFQKKIETDFVEVEYIEDEINAIKQMLGK